MARGVGMMTKPTIVLRNFEEFKNLAGRFAELNMLNDHVVLANTNVPYEGYDPNNAAAAAFIEGAQSIMLHLSFSTPSYVYLYRCIDVSLKCVDYIAMEQVPIDSKRIVAETAIVGVLEHIHQLGVHLRGLPTTPIVVFGYVKPEHKSNRKVTTHGQ